MNAAAVGEFPWIRRRPAVFSCLKSEDFQQEGVIPNSLCHISDEIQHSPANPRYVTKEHEKRAGKVLFSDAMIDSQKKHPRGGSITQKYNLPALPCLAEPDGSSPVSFLRNVTPRCSYELLDFVVRDVF